MAEPAWKQLLHVSTSLTAEAGGEQEKPPTEFNPEDLKFLNDALIGHYGPEYQGPTMIQKFFGYKDFTSDRFAREPLWISGAKELAENLDEYFIMGNYSEVFADADGLRALENLTLNTDDDTQLLYLRLIPSIAENRPEFQTRIVRDRIFSRLIAMLRDHRIMVAENVGALISAISAICRGCPEAWDVFEASSGLNHVFDLAQTTAHDLIAGKAAHMLSSVYTTLLAENPKFAHRTSLEIMLFKVYALLIRRQETMELLGDSIPEHVKEFVEETKISIRKKLLAIDGKYRETITRHLTSDESKESLHRETGDFIKNTFCRQNLHMIDFPQFDVEYVYTDNEPELEVPVHPDVRRRQNQRRREAAKKNGTVFEESEEESEEEFVSTGDPDLDARKLAVIDKREKKVKHPKVTIKKTPVPEDVRVKLDDRLAFKDDVAQHFRIPTVYSVEEYEQSLKQDPKGYNRKDSELSQSTQTTRVSNTTAGSTSGLGSTMIGSGAPSAPAPPAAAKPSAFSAQVESKLPLITNLVDPRTVPKLKKSQKMRIANEKKEKKKAERRAAEAVVQNAAAAAPAEAP